MYDFCWLCLFLADFQYSSISSHFESQTHTIHHKHMNFTTAYLCMQMLLIAIFRQNIQMYYFQPVPHSDYCSTLELYKSLTYLTYLNLVLVHLTLPYQTGKTFYRLAQRPLTGPMRISELTIRLQNLQVQYSPGSIPTLGTIPLPSDSLLTWTLLVSPREYQLEST